MESLANTFKPIACMEHHNLGLSATQCDLLHRAERSYERALREHPTPRMAAEIAEDVIALLSAHNVRQVVILDEYGQMFQRLHATSAAFINALRANQIRTTDHEAVFQLTGVQ